MLSVVLLSGCGLSSQEPEFLPLDTNVNIPTPSIKTQNTAPMDNVNVPAEETKPAAPSTAVEIRGTYYVKKDAGSAIFFKNDDPKGLACVRLLNAGNFLDDKSLYEKMNISWDLSCPEFFGKATVLVEKFEELDAETLENLEQSGWSCQVISAKETTQPVCEHFEP